MYVHTYLPRHGNSEIRLKISFRNTGRVIHRDRFRRSTGKVLNDGPPRRFDRVSSKQGCVHKRLSSKYGINYASAGNGASFGSSPGQYSIPFVRRARLNASFNSGRSTVVALNGNPWATRMISERNVAVEGSRIILRRRQKPFGRGGARISVRC